MINTADIKVGDLIERSSIWDKRVFGYVIEIKQSLCGNTEFWCNWSDENSTYKGYSRPENIIGHWKVINFEEENKMKTLSREDKVKLLMQGKELQKVGKDTVYRINGNKLEHKNASTKNKYIKSNLTITDLLDNEFVEYKETFKGKLKVGDWVKVTLNDKRVWLIQVVEVHEEHLHGTIYEELTGRIVNQYGNLHNFPDRKFELMTSEQVKEHKVGQVFKTVGRKPFEYKSMDVVMFDGDLYLVDYVNPTGFIDILSMKKTWLTRLSTHSKELTPVYFVEDKVKLGLEG